MTKPADFSDLPWQNATYMMKALSVVEMPGTAIACGRKTLEIRQWMARLGVGI